MCTSNTINSKHTPLLIQHRGWLLGAFKRCGRGCLASLLILDRATGGIPTGTDAGPDLPVRGCTGGSSFSQQLSPSSLSSSHPPLPFSFFFPFFLGEKKILELESTYQTAWYRTGGGRGSQLPERHLGGRTLVSPAVRPPSCVHLTSQLGGALISLQPATEDVGKILEDHLLGTQADVSHESSTSQKDTLPPE